MGITPSYIKCNTENRHNTLRMKKQRTIYIIIIALCLVTIGVSIYFALGGFDKTEVYFFEGTERTVIGKEYFIPNDNKAYYSIMDSARADIQSGDLTGKLTAIIFHDQWASKDSLHCFIGASQDSIGGGVVKVPAKYDFRRYQTDRIYKIFITQSGWVQPSPQSIEEIMKVRSIQEGEVLQPYTFELYYPDNSMSIEKWVK